MTAYGFLGRVVCVSALLFGAFAQRSSSQAPAAPDGLRFRYMGPESAGRIASVVGIPGDTSTYYAGAASGGVWKTTDGGRTWQRSLFGDENTGCSGLTMDARDPNVLFAGLWQVELHTWVETSGGPGSGVYKSTNGGTTWTRLGPALSEPGDARV